MHVMVPCSKCRRHVVAGSACPFCGTPQLAQPRNVALIGRMSRAAVFASAVSGCWTGTSSPPPPQVESQPATGVVMGVMLHAVDRGPLRGIEVKLTRAGVETRAVTDAQGRYRLDGLAPGEYTLSWFANLGSDPVARKKVWVHSGATVNIDLTANYERQPMAAPYGAPPRRRRVV